MVTQEQMLLLLDKEGIIAEPLIKNLEQFKNIKVTLVTSKSSNFLDPEQIEYMPYKKRLPKIPQRQYSHMLIAYNGEEELFESLLSFILEAEKISAELVFIIPLAFSKKEFLDNLLGAYKNLFIIIIGDFFGNDILLNRKTVINQFLYESKRKNRIIIRGSGIQKTFPIFIEDAIAEILEVIFKDKRASRIFLLFPKNSPTQLSLARMFKKADPEIGLDFLSENDNLLDEKINFFIPESGEYILGERYLLFQRVRQALDTFVEDKDMKNNSNFDESKINKPTSWTLFLKIGIFTILSSLFLPFFVTFLLSFLGFWQLQSARSAIEKGDFSLAQKEASISKTLFSYAQKTGQVFLFESQVLGKEDTVENFIADITKGKEISEAAVNVFNAFDIFSNIFSGTNRYNSQDFKTGINAIKSAAVSFQKLNLGENSFVRDLLINTVSVYPNLFGFEGEKRYLVLFQNNMELRPGGGFIGSYGILNLNKGRMTDFVIHDVYDADGQLKGHVEPPFPLRRYLPIVHWYLRDSNFFVDYPKGASMSAFFLSQETGEYVDGVIGIDLSFVKSMIKILGSVSVPEYKETVTEDNFYILTQTHAEEDFFPGSRQKKDFLQSLFRSLQRDFQEKKNIPYLKLLEAIGNGVLEKHLLFAFSDASIQNLFTVNNMSSSLWDGRESRETTINDFLGINEANIGINKANYFIKRKVVQDIVINKEGKISGKLTIMYKNTSKKSTWPGGDYKNYLRLILPFKTEISSIEIDGQDVKMIPAVTDYSIFENKNFKPAEGLEIERFKEQEKDVFGFLITVPADTLKTISIYYDLKQEIKIDEPVLSYDLKLFKQPGIDPYPFVFSLSYPDSFKISKTSNAIKKEKNKFTFTTNFSKDVRLKTSFSKK